MWAVVGSALAARRGQAVIVALVAVLASAAVAVAPWYAVAAIHQVTVDTVVAAPVAERLLAVNLRIADDATPPDDPAGDARRVFHPPGFRSVAGAEATGVLTVGGDEPPVDPDTGQALTPAARVAHREDLCDHLLLAGACPGEPGEVVLPAALAALYQVGPGDEVEFGRSGGEVFALTVVGLYQVIDIEDPYWGSGDVIGFGPGAERHTLFATLPTVSGLEQPALSYQLVLEPEALSGQDPDTLERIIADGIAALRTAGYGVTEPAGFAVLEAVRVNERNVLAGMGVGVAVLLLLTWFTLVVVLRGAVTQLRGDVGWWRLHGVPSGRGWLVALGQGVVPLVGGATLGGAAGLGLGWTGRLAGPAPPDDLAAGGLAPLLSLALVGVIVAGGLVAVVATQLRTLRTPVRDLLRRVPARGPRWRRSLVDLVVVLVAVAAVGQALVLGREEAEGVALLAPGLAVLAIALVAAWAVAPLAADLAARALHGGRLGLALVGASMARRAGTHRLVALVSVAVALVTAGFVGWDSDSRSQQQRAALEVGAHRVVTVDAAGVAELLAAVRAADPSGDHAMAVVQRGRAGSLPPVLAVDTTRLGVVADWREQEYGGPPGQIAAALRPSAPDPVVVTGESLAVEASATAPAEVSLRVQLRGLDTGVLVEQVLGPLTGRPRTYEVVAPGCAAGCRLVGLELLGEVQDDGSRRSPQPGTQVVVHDLAGAAEALADPVRWRPELGARDLGPAITSDRGRLVLTVPDGLPASVTIPASASTPVYPSFWAFVVETPIPVPVVISDWRPAPTDELRVAPFPGAGVPATRVGSATLLPGLTGAGILVDLEYAQRAVPAGVGVMQVWLSPKAPPSILEDLRAAGVVPVREQSLPGQLGRLRSEGSAVAVRFQTAVAVLALLLAAGAVLVFSAQERAGRAAELSALRAQGVRRGTVRVVGYGGLASVVGLAVLVGLVAGLAAAGLAALLHPGFVDGWVLLPAPGLRAGPVVAAGAAAVVVLAGAGLFAAAGLVRRTLRRNGRGA